jgi:hypothetical protein
MRIRVMFSLFCEAKLIGFHSKRIDISVYRFGNNDIEWVKTVIGHMEVSFIRKFSFQTDESSLLHKTVVKEDDLHKYLEPYRIDYVRFSLKKWSFYQY